MFVTLSGGSLKHGLARNRISERLITDGDFRRCLLVMRRIIETID